MRRRISSRLCAKGSRTALALALAFTLPIAPQPAQAAPNVKPTIESIAYDPIPAVVNRSFAITVAASDSDGTIVAYEWKFVTGNWVPGSATETHTYTAVGVYNVSVQVTDDRNGKTSAITTVDVKVTPAQGPVTEFSQTFVETDRMTIKIAALTGRITVVK